MQIDKNSYGSTPCAFKGLSFGPETTGFIVKNVKKAEDCKAVCDAISLLRACSYRDFNFRMQDGSLKCVISKPASNAYAKTASHHADNVLTVSNEHNNIVELFKRCREIARNASNQ